ncbi:YidH family protein [Marinobacter sp.]|uniref:YidH family protein n=1 Tax=Marinobacter sp. TaxID=50741 RepID=UPI00356B0A07
MSDLKDPRVLFAAERTLLAWNRTSLGLTAFGFLVERSGLLLVALVPERANMANTEITFWLGLSFIILGALSALYATRQYAVVLETLTPIEFPEGYKARWGMVINLVVAMLSTALALALILGRG